MTHLGRRGGAGAIVAALLALSWGCDTPVPAQDVAPYVVIGVVYPLSGDDAETGADLRRGVTLAAEIVNDEHALDLPLARGRGLPHLGGAPIRIVLGDHRGDPAEGAAQARDLLASGEVTALLGAYQSAVTAEVSLVAEEAGIPFLAPDSTAPSLTRRGLRWLFRTTADDEVFVAEQLAFLAALRAERGIAPGSAAIVYENGLFGTSVAALQTDAAREAGLPLVADIPYAADAASFESTARDVARSGAALVLQSSFERDAIGLMRAYDAIDYRPEAILAMNAGFVSPAFVASLGDDANDVLSREVWAEDLGETNHLIRQVSELFRARYGVPMTGNSARAFTGVLVLADAIDRAASTEPERIRQALLETDLPPQRLIVPWDGVRFDPATGQNVLARGIIVQIRDRTYRTVWPPELATTEVVWPMRP